MNKKVQELFENGVKCRWYYLLSIRVKKIKEKIEEN